MAEQWYVARDKDKFGPYTAARLKELAAQGRVLPTDMLHKEGEAKWVAANTVDGLFAAQVVPPPLPAVSAEAEKGSTPFVVPDIRQLATSGSLPPALLGVGAVLAPPLGLYCVWNHPRWTIQQKWVWTGAAAVVLLVGLFFIPRVVLALALLSGCTLAVGLVWTHTGLTLEQKRMSMSLSGMLCIIGLIVVLLAGQGSNGGGHSGESGGKGTANGGATDTGVSHDRATVIRCAKQVMAEAKIGASPEQIKTLMKRKGAAAGIDSLEPRDEDEDIVEGKEVLNIKYEGVRFSFIRDRRGQWGLLGGSIEGKTVLPGGDLR